MIRHAGHLAFSRSQTLDNRSDKVLRNVDRQNLTRLHQGAIDSLGHDRRTRNHQLKTFAAHHFNQYRKLQFATAENLEGLRRSGVFNANRNVGQKLPLKAILDVARGYEFAFATCKRRVVDGEVDRNRRLVDLDDRQRFRIVQRAETLTDGDAGNTGNRDDVTHRSLGRVFALQTVERKQLRYLDRHQRTVDLRQIHLLANLERAVEHAPDGQTTEIIRVVQIRHQNLQVAISRARGRRDRLKDQLKQRLEVRARNREVHRRRTSLAVGIDHREVQNRVIRIQIDEQVIDLIQHFLATCVRAVDLIDNDDRGQLCFKRL